MSAVTRPRGPLPSRVYWTRRVLVVALAVLLVLGISRMIGWSGGDERESGEAAAVVAARPAGGSDPAPSSGAATAGPSDGAEQDTTPTKRRGKKKALPRPDGPCLASDVIVTPVATTTAAYRPIEIVLEISTLESDACTWDVDPDTVFLTVTSELHGLHWASQHCGAAIPTQSVVARREKPARVTVRWNGRESVEGCRTNTVLLPPGLYTTSAIARGSVNATTGELVISEALTGKKGAPSPSTAPTDEPLADPTTEPSGAVEPSGTVEPSGAVEPSSTGVASDQT